MHGLGKVIAGRLAGKVCLITGTGGSIGRATALTFAREGAAVVGCDVGVEAAERTAALVHGAGGSMVSLQPCSLTGMQRVGPTPCLVRGETAMTQGCTYGLAET
ncbi:MAG TPA: SDR family NAD(P)-dependent oxidoreductase [Trebonia sp.]